MPKNLIFSVTARARFLYAMFNGAQNKQILQYVSYLISVPSDYFETM